MCLDVGLAMIVALVTVVTATVSAAPGDEPGWLATAVLIAGSAALAARRWAPVAVLVATTLSVVAYSFLDQPAIAGAGLPVLVAVYTAVQAGHRWPAVAVVGGGLSAGLLDTVLSGEPVGRAVADALVLKGWLLASGVFGEVVRKQRALTDQAEQRAESAEEAREEAARRRASEERLRIARELHDSLTHSISIIAVQTNVAVHLARKRGEEVPPALLAIQDASTQAARELRATLDVLRHESGPLAANLDQLPSLIEGAGRAGVTATLAIAGEPAPLPADIDGAAYRIVQEALTNVARHAGPVSAVVRLSFDPRTLTVEVDDDGRSTLGPAPHPGVGLSGMRERVDALGGHFAAGPRPGGGFRVRASLPLRRAERAGVPA